MWEVVGCCRGHHLQQAVQRHSRQTDSTNTNGHTNAWLHTPDALPPWVVCFHDSAARQPRRCLGDQVVAFLCRAQARGGAEQFRGPASIDKCAVDAGAAASTACLPAEPGCGLAAPPWVVPTLMLQEAWGAAGLATCAPLHTTEQPCHTTVLRSGTRTTREQPLVQKDAGLPRQYLQQWQQAN